MSFLRMRGKQQPRVEECQVPQIHELIHSLIYLLIQEISMQSTGYQVLF